LEEPVDPLGLLLLPELLAVGRLLRAPQAVLARRIVPALDGALVREAARPLQEELEPLPPAQPAHRIVVSGQARSSCLYPAPLGRPPPIGGNRGHVADAGDLDPPRLERADGRLATRPRTLHEDLDLLQAELHGLPGRRFRGHLGRERRRFAGALEP